MKSARLPRRTIGAGILTVGAVVAVGIVIAGVMVGRSEGRPAGHSGAAATARSAVSAAARQVAAAARGSAAPIPGPGQYWYVVAEAYRSGGADGLSVSRTSSVPTGPEHSARSQTWLAADGSGWTRVTPTDSSPHVPSLQRLKATAGSVSAPTPGYVAGLSTDPAALLRTVRAGVNVSATYPTTEAAEFDGIARLLIGGYVPAPVRAALVLDLGRLDSVSVAHDVTDALGRAAVAFTISYRTSAGEMHAGLLFSPTTGAFLQSQAAGAGVTTRTTIVSSAPASAVPADVRNAK